jgi:tRNA G18 (ribose-2'-O)-methylase SpoU
VTPPGNSRVPGNNSGEIVVDIADPDDDRIAAFRSMRDPVVRDELGCFIAEGPDIVRQCIAARLEIVSALIDSRGEGSVIEFDAPTQIWQATPNVIGRITGLGVHRGVLALVRRPTPFAPADVLSSARVIVALEAVENPVNVGLIARGAAALGADGLIVDATSGDPLYRRSVTASRGAVLGLPWARVEQQLGASLADRLWDGWTTVALTPTGRASRLDDVASSLAAGARIALLLGSEGPGLSDAAMQRAQHCARVPMHRNVDSLNVAVASGIALWELTRHRSG